MVVFGWNQDTTVAMNKMYLPFYLLQSCTCVCLWKQVKFAQSSQIDRFTTYSRHQKEIKWREFRAVKSHSDFYLASWTGKRKSWGILPCAGQCRVKMNETLELPQYLHFNDQLANCYVCVVLSLHLHFFSSPNSFLLSYCVFFLVKAQLFAICLSHPFAGTPSMKMRQFGVKWGQARIWTYLCIYV